MGGKRDAGGRKVTVVVELTLEYRMPETTVLLTTLQIMVLNNNNNKAN